MKPSPSSNRSAQQNWREVQVGATDFPHDAKYLVPYNDQHFSDHVLDSTEILQQCAEK